METAGYERRRRGGELREQPRPGRRIVLEGREYSHPYVKRGITVDLEVDRRLREQQAASGDAYSTVVDRALRAYFAAQPSDEPGVSGAVAGDEH